MTSPYTAVNEVRTTLRDDLIAAKALIEWPAIWPPETGVYGVIQQVILGREPARLKSGLQGVSDIIDASKDPRYLPMVNAVREAAGVKSLIYMRLLSQDQSVAAFDRAIASAESSS